MPNSVCPLLHGRGRVAGLRHLPARLAFRRHRRVEEEGGELDVQIVDLLESLDLDEADVTPRSDEVGKDQQ